MSVLPYYATSAYGGTVFRTKVSFCVTIYYHYATMKITINGESHIFPDNISVENMLALLELETTKVAVERNLAIIPRSHYTKTALMDGDEIEIVHFIGGG